jgi:tetratricopeptide (TPR) repeat protein
MKWIGKICSGTLSLTLTAAITAATLSIFALAGCQHKSVDDVLSAGDFAMQNTKLAEAEKDYRKAATMAPKDPRPHFALGNLYFFEQKPAQAETEYEKVIELAPRDAQAHMALGNVFASQNRLELAEEQYRAAVAIDAVNPSYRINLGKVLHREGKLDEAGNQLRTAIGLDARNAHAHLELGQVLSGEPGHEVAAEAEFARARTLDPSLFPAPATTTAPTAPPVAAAEPGTAPAPAAAALPKVHPLKRKFLLTHNSPVYETPQQGSKVLAQVHRGKYVNVTGIAGKWLRIRLRSGVIGFIPVTAAE